MFFLETLHLIILNIRIQTLSNSNCIPVPRGSKQIILEVAGSVKDNSLFIFLLAQKHRVSNLFGDLEKYLVVSLAYLWMILEHGGEVDEPYFEDVLVFVDVEKTQDQFKKDLLILIHNILWLQLLLIRPLFLYQLPFLSFFNFFILNHLILLLFLLSLFLLDQLTAFHILGLLLLSIVRFLDLILLFAWFCLLLGKEQQQIRADDKDLGFYFPPVVIDQFVEFFN